MRLRRRVVCLRRTRLRLLEAYRLGLNIRRVLLRLLSCVLRTLYCRGRFPLLFRRLHVASMRRLKGWFLLRSLLLLRVGLRFRVRLNRCMVFLEILQAVLYLLLYRYFRVRCLEFWPLRLQIRRVDWLGFSRRVRRLRRLIFLIQLRPSRLREWIIREVVCLGCRGLCLRFLNYC